MVVVEVLVLVVVVLDVVDVDVVENLTGAPQGQAREEEEKEVAPPFGCYGDSQLLTHQWSHDQHPSSDQARPSLWTKERQTDSCSRRHANTG